jgi:hypothetical protein
LIPIIPVLDAQSIKLVYSLNEKITAKGRAPAASERFGRRLCRIVALGGDCIAAGMGDSSALPVKYIMFSFVAAHDGYGHVLGIT